MRKQLTMVAGLCLGLIGAALAGDFGMPGARIRDGNPITSVANVPGLSFLQPSGALISFRPLHAGVTTTNVNLSTLGERIQLYPGGAQGQPNTGDTAISIGSSNNLVLTTPSSLYVSPTNGSATFQVVFGNPDILQTVGGGVALQWPNGNQNSRETTAPEFHVTCDDNIVAGVGDSGENFCSIDVPNSSRIWLNNWEIYVEVNAATCTTAPTYDLDEGTTYGTALSTWVSNCGPTTTSSNSAKSCGNAGGVESRSGGGHVWITTHTAASTCLIKVHHDIDYYMS